MRKRRLTTSFGIVFYTAHGALIRAASQSQTGQGEMSVQLGRHSSYKKQHIASETRGTMAIRWTPNAFTYILMLVNELLITPQ